MSAANQLVSAPPNPAAATALGAYLAAGNPAPSLTAYRGALTARVLSGTDPEVATLTAAAGIYDLGYLAFLRVYNVVRQ